jgi:hypothetical protein
MEENQIIFCPRFKVLTVMLRVCSRMSSCVVSNRGTNISRELAASIFRVEEFSTLKMEDVVQHSLVDGWIWNNLVPPVNRTLLTVIGYSEPR